ncbi:MAG: DoxX family protein [bacterium]|nr:DoxX family protein [bacterium]
MKFNQNSFKNFAVAGGFTDFGGRVGSLFMTPSLYGDWGLLIFRVIIAVIFLTHGFQKMHFWQVRYGETIPKHILMLYRVSSFYEVVSAVALIVGFFTHVIILGLVVIMLGGIYYKHIVWRKGFTGEGGWEIDLLMLAGLILLFFLGSGNFSVDHYVLGF